VSRSSQEVGGLIADRAVEQAILLALKGIRFGSVEIIVHDSKIVQIERKEKTRFDHPSSGPVS
jgi:hypothetical protein